MIVYHALHKELRSVFYQVFFFIFALALTLLLLKVLRQAMRGYLQPALISQALMWTSLGYLGSFLTIALFLSILLVLTRWHRDTEMPAWLNAGFHYTNLIYPVLRFSLPWLVGVAISAFFLWPLAQKKIADLRHQFEIYLAAQLAVTQQFHEVGAYIFFIESWNAQQKVASNIFLFNHRNQSFLIAKRATLQNTLAQSWDLILQDGQQYFARTEKENFRMVEFQHLRIHLTPSTQLEKRPPRQVSNTELMTASTPEKLAELLWRLSLPIAALILCLIAIPISHHHVKRGRYSAFIAGLIVYFTYYGLLNFMQAHVAQVKVSAITAILVPHLIFLLLGLFVFYWKDHRFTWVAHWRLLKRSVWRK